MRQVRAFVEAAALEGRSRGMSVTRKASTAPTAASTSRKRSIPALDELERGWAAIRDDASFRAELGELQRTYVGRPTPLYLAERIGDGRRVYLKREDLCHTGAHKINNAVGQALIARRLEKQRIVAETGAGQHGVAAATVCARFGMECVVYMGAEDMERQKPNVERMGLLGAEVRPVEFGTRTLKEATSEAIRDWITNVGDHPLPDRLLRRPAPVSGDRARAPGRHRRRGARPDPRGRGAASGRGCRLRRGRLERDRHVRRLRRGRRTSD